MCNYFTSYREPTEMQRQFKFLELPNDTPRYIVRPTGESMLAKTSSNTG